MALEAMGQGPPDGGVQVKQEITAFCGQQVLLFSGVKGSWWVHPNGDDTAQGDFEPPLKTLSEAWKRDEEKP